MVDFTEDTESPLDNRLRNLARHAKIFRQLLRFDPRAPDMILKNEIEVIIRIGQEALALFDEKKEI